MSTCNHHRAASLISYPKPTFLGKVFILLATHETIHMGLSTPPPPLLPAALLALSPIKPQSVDEVHETCSLRQLILTTKTSTLGSNRLYAFHLPSPFLKSHSSPEILVLRNLSHTLYPGPPSSPAMWTHQTRHPGLLVKRIHSFMEHRMSRVCVDHSIKVTLLDTRNQILRISI